jgi:hypothetical protein
VTQNGIQYRVSLEFLAIMVKVKKEVVLSEQQKVKQEAVLMR